MRQQTERQLASTSKPPHVIGDDARGVPDVPFPVQFRELTLRVLTRMQSRREPREGMGYTVLVTSVAPGEGKSFTALGLARCAAGMLDSRTLLVDANVAAPTLHRHFGAADSPGLCEKLMRPHDSDVSARVVAPGLELLPAGRGDPAFLFNSSQVAGFLSEAANRYRLVVVDGQSLGTSGANSLPYLADGVLLVVDSTTTRREVAKGVLGRLGLDPGRFLGAVLNKKRHYIPEALYRSV